MPLLAELVDEQFAAQYGYIYAAAQTSASAAYAFGPLIGGAMLNHHYLSFESLMHLIGLANLILCVVSFFLKSFYHHAHLKHQQSSIEQDSNEEVSCAKYLDLELKFWNITASNIQPQVSYGSQLILWASRIAAGRCRHCGICLCFQRSRTINWLPKSANLQAIQADVIRRNRYPNLWFER